MVSFVVGVMMNCLLICGCDLMNGLSICGCDLMNGRCNDESSLISFTLI